MPVWLGVLILVAVVALTVAIVWGVKRWGQYTEQSDRTTRATVERLCTRMEDAVREINASTALLHASLNDSLVTIANLRTQRGPIDQHTEPHPAPFTSEENDTDDPIRRVSG